MNHRNVAYQRATGKSGPIESMSMDYVKFVTMLSQLQEEFKEEISLGKEAIVGFPFLCWPIKIRWSHTFRYRYGNDANARDKGVVACEQSHAMTSLYQSLRQVCQQCLRSSEVGLRDSRNEGRDQCDSHNSPR